MFSGSVFLHSVLMLVLRYWKPKILGDIIFLQKMLSIAGISKNKGLDSSLCKVCSLGCKHYRCLGCSNFMHEPLAIRPSLSKTFSHITDRTRLTKENETSMICLPFYLPNTVRFRLALRPLPRMFLGIHSYLPWSEAFTC